MTPVEERILEGLATFRFLTRDQMRRIGVGRDRKHLGDMLRRMVRMGAIGEMRFGVYPGLGRLPAMFYLKAKGAKALAEFRREPSDLYPFTKGKPHFEVDHLHRRYCVDCHIALEQWATGNGEVLFFIPYYASGNQGTGSTRVNLDGEKHYRPDALFCIERRPDHKELYAFEMCMNKRGKDTKRIVEQMTLHREALFSGAIGDKFNIPVGNLVLLVFEAAAGLEAVRKHAEANPVFKDCGEWMWFNEVGHVADDFATGWRDLRGEPVAF